MSVTTFSLSTMGSPAGVVGSASIVDALQLLVQRKYVRSQPSGALRGFPTVLSLEPRIHISLYIPKRTKLSHLDPVTRQRFYPRNALFRSSRSDEALAEIFLHPRPAI